MEDGTGTLQLVEIQLTAVEAAKIVDDGHHELHGVIGFEKEALVTFHGEAGGVGLAETIAAKTFYLPPHFAGQLDGVR